MKILVFMLAICSALLTGCNEEDVAALTPQSYPYYAVVTNQLNGCLFRASNDEATILIRPEVTLGPMKCKTAFKELERQIGRAHV